MKYLRPNYLRLPNEVQAKLYRFGWNQRVLTYSIFEDFCADHSITVISAPLDPLHPDEYDVIQGRDRIKLGLHLRGYDLTLTAWHEAGHFLMHVPGHFVRVQRTESHADFIGYAALIPLHLIKRYTDWEIAEEYGYPLQYCRERRTLRDIFGY